MDTIFCDPFFGYGYPATVGVNQVVASSTTYKAGVNGGAGLDSDWDIPISRHW